MFRLQTSRFVCRRPGDEITLTSIKMADEKKLTLKSISLIANQDVADVKRLDASKRDLTGLGDLR